MVIHILLFTFQKVSCHWKCWQAWCQLWWLQHQALATKWNRIPKMVSLGPKNCPLRFQSHCLVCTGA